MSLAPRLTWAQIIAPPLEHRALEAGYTYKWFHRVIESGSNEIKWQAGSLYARYGGFQRLTVYAEGGIWDVDSYSRWVVGGGLTGLLYTRGWWSLDVDASYNEIYDLDETTARTDHRTYGWNAALVARGSFAVSGQRVDLYAGPAYVNDVAETYPFSSNDPVRTEPDQHWGACAGLYATALDYVSGFAYLLYLDQPQLRLGVSLRSRGETP